MATLSKLGIERALSIDGVKGVFIPYRGVIGKTEQVPDLIKVNSPLM